MTIHWLRYQARSFYSEWGRAAGFVLGFWLALLLLLPMVVPGTSQSRTAGDTALPHVAAPPPEAPDSPATHPAQSTASPGQRSPAKSEAGATP